MNEIVVSQGQSLLDISLWLLGGTEALFALADANELGIADPLTPGQVLLVPEGYTVNPELVSYYRRRGLRVNTTNDLAPPAPAPAGLIDFDDNDFDDSDFY